MRKILRALMLFAIFVHSSASLFAQGRTVTGTVYDDKGMSLPGASVTIKNTKTSAGTDVNGKYTIPVPAGPASLVFSFIGSTTQEVVIGTRTTINVTLKSAATALNEVVVIGYGSQKREDVNGAISSIKASDIANIPQVSVDQLLQGKAAGVTVTQNSGAAGSNTSVHIRGITSLSLSNEPLYVIDGVPLSGDANNIATSGRPISLSNKGQTGSGDGETTSSPLSTIDPNDIESIDVLKDASATAIYGSRGSNGVVIITTKRGRNGSARIAYDGYYGFQQQGKFLDVMNLQQYAALQNSLGDIAGTGRRGEFADPSLLGSGTNWQKQVFRTGIQQSHQLSVSGGKEGTDYYISGGYLNQNGTIIGNNFDRYSMRVNVNSQVKKWFKIGTSLSGSRTFQNNALSDNNGIVYLAALSAPDQAVYNTDGSFAGPLPQAGQTGGQLNPVALASTTTNKLGSSNINGSMYADLQFYKDLTLHSELDGDFRFNNAHVFLPTYAYGPYFVNSTAKLSEYASNSSYYGLKEYLTYTHTFAQKHNITGLLGYELSDSEYGGLTTSAQNFVAGNSLQVISLGDAKTVTATEYKGPGDILQSVFARAIYSYNSKYSLTATIRSDESSKFAEGHRTGYFPSFAVSWRVSDEPFMAKVKEYADNIKFRLGYGAVGNQGIPNYRYGSTLTSFTTGLGTAFAVGNIANPNLTWETALQTDIGLDFSLFNNRIDASVDYFNKTSKKFLFQAALPAFLLGQTAEYSGTGVIAPPFINGGQVNNRGVDFSITSRNFTGNAFKWSTTLIFSHYTNKVISLANGTPFIPGNINVSFLSLPVTRTAPGLPVGEFYGYKVLGIFKTDEQLRSAPVQFGRLVSNTTGGTWLGDIQYVDTNHDGKIDANDQVPLGSPNPKFTYGFTNNFSYKSFDLSVFLNGSYGAKIFNALNYQDAGLSGLYTNQLASAANYWTPANNASDIPTPRIGDNPNLLNSNRFLESGSFLRIQNVQLGYNLPAKLIKHASLARLRVYASGQNLYVFTPYKGLDPEVGALNQNVFLTNVDAGRYPIPRTITFGINAEF